MASPAPLIFYSRQQQPLIPRYNRVDMCASSRYSPTRRYHLFPLSANTDRALRPFSSGSKHGQAAGGHVAQVRAPEPPPGFVTPEMAARALSSRPAGPAAGRAAVRGRK